MLQSTKLLFLLALTFNVLSLSVHAIQKGRQTPRRCYAGSFQLTTQGDGDLDHIYYIVADRVPASQKYEYVQFSIGKDAQPLACWKQTFLNGRKAIKMEEGEAYLMPYDQVKENNWQWATVGGLKWLNQSPYTSADITFQGCDALDQYKVVATFRGVVKGSLVAKPNQYAYFADQKYINANNLGQFTCFRKKVQLSI